MSQAQEVADMSDTAINLICMCDWTAERPFRVAIEFELQHDGADKMCVYMLGVFVVQSKQFHRGM